MNTANLVDADAGSLERALLIVRLLATTGARGAGLTDISGRTGIPHPTVHRLLRRLSAQGLVRQMSSTKRYALGPLAFEIGLAAAQQFDIRSVCRPALVRISEEVGDTAYLVQRSGLEAVCVDRQEGPSPIRVLTLDIGSRRPLGLGAAGLAMLGALPDGERQQLARQLAEAVWREGKLPKTDFLDSVEQTHKNGFSFIRNRVTLGTSAVGVPLTDGLGNPVAAISVAAVDARMTEPRIAVIEKVLRREAAQLHKVLKEGRAFRDT